MTAVGVRELRNRLSHYLSRVRQGEHLTVTDRGEPIALITPSGENDVHRRLMAMVERGEAYWNGKKPRDFKPVKTRGAKLASEIVIEDRR
jgi:prevent-host-death family protein